MKEVEKNEIKRLSDRLDAIRHQQAALSLVENTPSWKKKKQRWRRKSLVCTAW